MTSTDDHDPQQRPRSPNGRLLRSVETAERDAAAASLRESGHTFQQIAEELGFCSRGAAHDAVNRALHAIVKKSAEELRQREAERLDGLYEEALSVLERTHYAHSHGRLVLDTDGAPLPDDGPRLAALREMRQVRESYRRLHGLDAAQAADVTVRQTAPPADESDRRERLGAVAAEIARRTASGQAPDAEDLLSE
ncbi:hypothetical protein [Streptomyces boncukensis]|uniref:Uncharacterized protein n=1 Tax=Streptomyces boncukensis TaxID=2711219 RepID=A0A6G4WZT4_9ACTN|nr:hypothetical protein [Streptomyces boncukensis]NGO70513.1 hypothetical protein [Streptomyces boncukensis]